MYFHAKFSGEWREKKNGDNNKDWKHQNKYRIWMRGGEGGARGKTKRLMEKG
jgi:hypothetical protein